MRCRDAEKDLLLYYYEELDPSATEEIKRHLETCSRCLYSWEKIRTSLDKLKIKEHEPADAYWNNYLEKVYEKIEAKGSKKYFVVLKPAIVYVFAIILVIITGIGGFKVYEKKQEDAFVTKNHEMIKDLELLENLEILQDLEEIENIKT
ncbi:MAG: zf-HC2 domain-containing protein [Thermodesulfovibrionales bacterium]|nr:zf-HC2 domain-containing protein [Thermodesulfovibrionales bacterium]